MDPQHLTKQLWRYGRGRLLAIVALMLLLSAGEGVGLLLLLPLLSVAGYGAETSAVTDMAVFRWVTDVTERLGDPLLFLLLLYVALIGSYAVVNAYHQVLTARLVNGFAAMLRKRANAALLGADWLHTARLRQSHLLNALTIDVERIRHGVQQAIALTGTAVLGCVYLAVTLLLDPMVGVLFVVFALGIAWLLRPLGRRATGSGRALGDAYRRMQSAAEHLGAMKVTKSLQAEPRVRADFDHAADSVAAQAVHLAKIQARTNLTYQIAAVVVLSAFVYLALSVAQLSLSVLAVLIVLFARLTPRLRQLHQGVQAVFNMLPAFAELDDVTTSAERSQEGSTTARTGTAAAPQLRQSIRLEDIWFRYPGEEAYAVRGISAEIRAHAITRVTGYSGAGKSTLADLLMGLMVPESGRILIDGEPLTDANRHAWRHTVAYMPQETWLFAGSIRDNLAWAKPEAREDELKHALRQARADGFVQQLPQGLDTLLGDRGLRLSGGQRQRIALARTLLRQPQLLILDEPTSGLDADNITAIEEALSFLASQMTIVILGHRPANRAAGQVLEFETDTEFRTA